jgi:phosphonate transport system ATP-binding protein
MNIELKDLSARYASAATSDRPCLERIGLRIERGEQVAVIGPSGAGKTSLLQVMACALKPFAGEIMLDGQSPWTMSRRALHRLRGRLFLAPQVPPLPPRQRVVTSVLAARLPAMGLWASLRSLVYPSDIPAAFQALVAFGMGAQIFERVDRLAGGERQRVALARALLAPASLWLVDEPLSALDPTRADQAMSSLCQQAHERQVTLVVSLHQTQIALERFPRILGLRHGELAFDLPAAQVTTGVLNRLYAQHENELHSDSLALGSPVADPTSPAGQSM